MPLLVVLTLWWSPLMLEPGEFLEGPVVDLGSGQQAWLARRGSTLWVCWRGPRGRGGNASPDWFTPLPLPADIDPAGNWQVRFADHDRLELLDHHDRLWTRERRDPDWSLVHPPPAEPALLRSTLFFSGISRPCSHLGRPVPRFESGSPTWHQLPCPKRCPQRARPNPSSSQLAGLRARVFVSATRSRLVTASTPAPAELPRKSLSWDASVWMGLDLSFDAQRRRLAQRPVSSAPSATCEVAP